MVLCIVRAALLRDGKMRSRSPSFKGVRMQPAIVVEHGKVESDTTFILVSGQSMGSNNLVRSPSDVSESFHDARQLCLHQIMQPSAAKQSAPVTKICNQPLYIAFCSSLESFSQKYIVS